MKKLLLITSALVALGAGPAAADPVSAVATWIGTTFSVGAATALAIANTAFGIGASLLAQALAPKPDAPELSVKFDVQWGDDNPLSFIAGDYVTAGKRKYIGSWGKDTRFITDVIEVSGLPQPGLIDMWVDDEQATFTGKIWGIDPNDDPSGFSDQGEYDPGSLPAGWISAGRAVSTYSDDGNRIYVKYIDGTQIAADPFLTMVFGSDPDYPWTADMIGTGKSYAIVTTRYDDDTLTSYPAYLFQPDALPMYDIRKDDTAGGVGAHRWSQPETYEPSRNPAVIAYNIIRGISFGSEWVWGGKDLAAWRLPAAEWMAAANECDDPVTLADSSTEPCYRCGMEIDVSMTPADVLEEIGKAANMHFAEVGGMIKPIVGLPGAAAMSITDDSIIITEGQSFKPFYPVSDTFNALSATYPEPGEKWTTKDSPEFIDTDAMDSDGGRYLPTSVSYPAAPYGKQVQRLQRAQMQDFRRFRRHQFQLPPEAYALEPGVDMVSWTSARNGYVDKLFVVESVAKTPGMNVLVSLREVDPSDYDWSSGFEVPTDIATPVNPVPFTQPITGLSVQAALINDGAGQPRRPAIRVTADGDESAGVTHIQIQARIAGQSDTVIDTNRRFSTPFTWYLQDVIPATNYEVRARLISERTPKSQWSAWLSVTTLDQRYTLEDMAQDVLDEMEATAEAAGIKAVTTLPATGDKPNQIVMKVPEGKLYRWDETAQEWTTEIYTGIADGAIDDTAKFAQGIEPVSVIPNANPLPTTKSTETIFWQGKLYRWNGSAYTASVPTSDLQGQITATQIADAAISGQKIADGAVDAIKLASQAVTGDKIAVAAVGADQIAARAIVASKLAVMNFDNLVPDNRLQEPSDWFADGWVTTNLLAPEWDVPKGWHLMVGAGMGWLSTPSFPVRGGMEYFGRFQARKDNDGNDAQITVRFRWFDRDGNFLSHSNIFSGSLGIGQGDEYSNSVTAPTAATDCVINVNPTVVNSDIRITGFYVREKNAGELIVDGSITTSLLAAGSVTADTIAANTITSNEIAANAITATELSANSVTTNHLTANSVTTGKIAAAAIGADQIAAQAIVASKLAVGSFENIVPDNRLLEPLSWFADGWSEVQLLNAAWDVPRGWVKQPGSGVGWLNTPRFPVRGGGEYFGRFQARKDNDGLTSSVICRFRWFDRDGTFLSESNIFNGNLGPTNGTTYSGSVTAPAAATEAVFGLNPTQVDSPIRATGFYVREKNAGELIVDGGITTNLLAAGSVTANSIAASAIVASKIAAGAVTADKISVSSLSAISATIGFFQTAPSGERMVLSDDRIRIFDASGTLRVKIGNLA